MEEKNTPDSKSIISFLNPLPILIGLIGLIPFFGLPFFNLPIAADKTIFFTLAVILGLMVWLIARLMDGSFAFPQTKLLLVAGVIILVLFISTLFSGAILPSFFGGGVGDSGAFFYTLLLFVLLFLAAISFQTVRHFSYFFFAV